MKTTFELKLVAAAFFVLAFFSSGHDEKSKDIESSGNHIETDNARPKNNVSLATIMEHLEKYTDYGKVVDKSGRYSTISSELRMHYQLLQDNLETMEDYPFMSSIIGFAVSGPEALPIENYIVSLIKQGALINAAGKHGDSAIIKAALKNRGDVVKCLVKHGADVGVKRLNGTTLLMLAVLNNNSDLVSFLLDAGVSVNDQNKDGETALMMAVQRKNIEITRILLNNGADANILSKSLRSAFTDAIINSDEEMVNELVNNGALIDEKMTVPLILATQRDEKEIVAMLLEKSADVNITDKDGNSAIFYALENKNEYIIDMLLASDINVDKKDNVGIPLLNWLIQCKYPQQFQRALQKGANVNIADAAGITPLMLSSYNREYNVVSYLLSQGANVNATSRLGCTALDLARELKSLKGGEETCKILERHGAVAKTSSRGTNGSWSSAWYEIYLKYYNYMGRDVEPLIGGRSMREYEDILAQLNDELLHNEIASKIETSGEMIVDRRDDALSQNSLEELKEIQVKLKKLKCKDSDSRWSQKRILEILPRILDGEGVNYSGPDMKGNTCLHYACELGSRQLIHWLVENGADVNCVEYGGGNTPLHNAARLASLHTVTYLLEHGANPHVRNNQGLLPCDVVGKDDHDAIVARLLEN